MFRGFEPEPLAQPFRERLSQGIVTPMQRILYPLFAAVMALHLSMVEAQAQSRDSVRAYVFGNSLVHHLSETDETTVPHWLSLFARASNKKLRLNGQWGFLRDFAENLPPVPNWSFKKVTSAWDSERRSFRKAGFDTIMINPANFIQYQDPDRAFDGDNAQGYTPLGLTLDVFDWVAANSESPRYFIY